MLGAPCSPCCDSCTHERAYELWQSLQARTYTVTVGGTIPAQDANMGSQGFSSNAVPGASATDPSTWFWTYRKQMQSVAGEHELALNFGQETWGTGSVYLDGGTRWFPDDGSGSVSFVSKTDDYAVRLIFDVQKSSTPSQSWPGTKCQVTVSLWVVCQMRSAFSYTAPPSVVASTVTKTATRPWDNASVTKSIVTSSPPYSQFIGTALGTFRDQQRNQYSAVDYSGSWDSVDKPSSLPWQIEYLTYPFSFQGASVDDTGAVSIQFLPVTSASVPSNVWEQGDGGGTWVKALSPGSLDYWVNQANSFHPYPAFRAEYSASDKHYVSTTLATNMTASVESIP